MATQYAFGQIVTSGLVLSLNAADRNSYPGSGTTWTDNSGNNNNATLTNGPTFSSANGGSLLFDGVDDFGVINQETNLSVTTITVSAWIRPNLATMPAYGGVINKLTGNSENGWSMERFSTANTISWWVGDRTVNTTPWSNNNIQADLTDNTWQQMVGLYDGTYLKLYKNGVFVTERVSSMGILTGTAATHIAKHGVLLYYWKGNIAQTSIYNRALSASEVAQNYNAQKSRFGL
jgi:hypothetical protein